MSIDNCNRKCQIAIGYGHWPEWQRNCPFSKFLGDPIALFVLIVVNQRMVDWEKGVSQNYIEFLLFDIEPINCWDIKDRCAIYDTCAIYTTFTLCAHDILVSIKYPINMLHLHRPKTKLFRYAHKPIGLSLTYCDLHTHIYIYVELNMKNFLLFFA